jgi:uncharacterized protein YndB with AHSA1/START domain
VPKHVTPDQPIKPTDREVVITRIFDAPRDLVFEAFTNPERLMKWWGPNGCTVLSCEAEPRAGGTWSISMRSPRVLPQFANRHPVTPESRPGRSLQGRSGSEPVGSEHEWIVERQRGVYQEVIKPERLVFTYAFEDDSREPLHQTVVTISFADESGRTRLTLRQSIFESVSARDDHIRGWTEALEHLVEYLLSTDRERT